MLFFIFLLIAFFVWFLVLKNKKKPITNSINLVTGGVKTGKSTLSVYLVLKKYRKNLFVWLISLSISKTLFLSFNRERPLLYSNIPLKCSFGYVPLSKDILTRKKNVPLNSVFYIGEFSLVADSMSYSDKIINEQLLLFLKLFGHQCNGFMCIDTQSFHDCHFALKRCINRYIYIERSVKLPFLVFMRLRELISIDENSVNIFDKDIEENNKWVLIPKKIWKNFDYRCYSILTDNLEKEKNAILTDNLKCNDIVSFKKYITLKNEVSKNG